MRVQNFLSAFTILFLFTFCASHDPADSEYMNTIIEQREAKNLDFRTAEHSPIKPDMKSEFAGLKYFAPDPSWRFSGPITRPDSAIVDTILGTKAKDKRPAERYGTFKFSKDGQEMSLLVYKMLRSKSGYEDYLFLGFTDKTSGKESYIAGRYIDLVENSDNHYVVDFNKAYNPYCAYNDKFSCAIPPLQNNLPVAVTAGEKSFK